MTYLIPPNPNNAQFAAAIAPSDTVSQATPFRGIYVGVSGDINLVTMDGVANVFKGVPVGPLPVGGVRVNATGTTATNLLALY